MFSAGLNVCCKHIATPPPLPNALKGLVGISPVGDRVLFVYPPLPLPSRCLLSQCVKELNEKNYLKMG